jgi:glyoxylase-like metal-dependent hydrolase (beta-lactamase superfamily II)
MGHSNGRTVLRVLLLSCAAIAARGAEPAIGFTHTPLGSSVHLLQGYECNIVVSAGDDGIVIVDTCTAKTAERLLAAIRRVSPKPIRYVIDTHVHGDHTGGNAFFQKYAPVVARNSVRYWLTQGNEVTKDKPVPREELPAITFDGQLSFYLNDEEIRLLAVGPAHTDGDTVVFFKNAGVVAMGDVFMSPAVSFGDRHYGGGMLKLIDTLELLLPKIPGDAIVIPGHGAAATRDDVARGLEVLKQMKAVVERAVKEGKTLAQLTAERPFDPWRGSLPAWASSDKSLDGWVRNFHRELSAK